MGRLGIGLIALLAVTSCTDGPGNEDVLVGTVYVSLCDKLAECGCVTVEEASACGALPLGVGEGGLAPDVDGGGVAGPVPAYDPECAERMAALVRGLECSDSLSDLGYADICPIYHGTLLEGQECGVVLVGDVGPGGSIDTNTPTCGAGLYCIQGICRNPADVQFGGFEQPCDLNGCDDDLACFEGVCLPRPVAGQECFPSEDGSEPCAEGARCSSANTQDGTFFCEPVLGEGAPCTGHAQCASGNCPAGRCAPPGGIGSECDSQIPCADNLDCDFSLGVCVDLAGQGAEICRAIEVEITF